MWSVTGRVCRARRREVDTQGDSFFVVFARATQAVAAAVASQRALATAAWPEGGNVRVRIGIHTGEPIQPLTSADSAARLQQSWTPETADSAARPGTLTQPR